MGWYPHAIVTTTLQELPGKYGIPQEAINGLIGEVIQAIHESAFKGTPTDALLGVYHSLGPEIAWQFWGLVYRCLEGSKGEFLSDKRDLWYETAVRLDSQLSRFSSILKRWSEEKAHELEQQRLEANDGESNRQ